MVLVISPLVVDSPLQGSTQRFVLLVRWAQHIPWHEDTHYVALCHVDVVDALPDLLLGDDVVVVHCALLVQSPPVCVLGFHHQLSVSTCLQAMITMQVL